MSIKNLLMLPVAATLLITGTFAQEKTGSANTSSTDATTATANKVDGDIDEEITNARMRAASGSRSKISMSASLGYDGGSIKNPLSAERPNLSGDPEVLVASEFGGSISARYRANKNDSFTFGAGVSYLQPLQDGDKYQDANEFNVSNPSLGYSRVYKIGSFQTISGASYTHGTSEGWDRASLNSIVGVSHTMMHAFKRTNFSAGVSFGFNVFNNGDVDGLSQDDDTRNRFSMGIYPMAEYQISDRFVARTVFGYFNFRNRRNQSNTDFRRNYEYQSVGIGIVASRDIWIYPNVQFIPDNLSVDNTNVAVSATMNLF
jgi:hypothetical protein